MKNYKIQKSMYLSQIQKFVFAVVIVLFSMIFIKEAKAETVDEVSKELFDIVQIQTVNDIQDNKLNEADISEINVNVEYGEISVVGERQVNGVARTVYTAYRDFTFTKQYSSVTLRVSVYYYYADGDYAEIYDYAVQQINRVNMIWVDEHSSQISTHGTFARLIIDYDLTFISDMENDYAGMMRIDIDYWGEIDSVSYLGLTITT